VLRVLIALPFLLVLILFALSNRQPVTLAFWPTDFALTMPLSLAILLAMALAFLLGALFVWIPGLAVRRRARRFERTTQRLEAQLAELQRNPPPSGRAVTVKA
jgi:uncharacterized integral membrane protein